MYIPKIEKEAIKLTFDNVEYWELTEDGYSRYSIVDWLIEPIYKTDGYDEIVIIGRGAQKYPRKVVTGYNYKTINPYENNT